MSPIRALFVGAIAGAIVSNGYILLIAINSLVSSTNYTAYLGGDAIIINGVPRVELPTFITYFTLAGMIFWGVLLSAPISKRARPTWWKVAPLMWLSSATSLLFGYLMLRANIKTPDLLIPLVGYASFGVLLGCTLRSTFLAFLLGLACSLSYCLALFLSLIVPADSIVGNLMRYTSNQIPYLQSREAVYQTAIWIAHGAAMGIAVWGVDHWLFSKKETNSSHL